MRLIPFLTLILLLACTPLGVYTRTSCVEEGGVYTHVSNRPVFRCDTGKTVIYSRAPCDSKPVYRCEFPREQVAEVQQEDKTLFEILQE